MPTLDAAKNFAVADVAQGYGAGETSVSVASGAGSKFPAVIADGEFNLVWWNYSDFKNPSEDPDVEIVRCVARSGDVLTVARAQEGTAASAKNVAGKTYRVMLAPTAKMIADIEAELDAKSDVGHVHDAADISDFDEAVEANAVVAGAVEDIAAHAARTDNPHGVTKAQVGLGNVTNDAQIPASQKGAAGGVAELDGSGKVPSSQMPPLALTDVFVVASQAAQLALTAEEGDVAIRVDLNKSYIHNGGTAGTMADWSELLTPTDAVLSVNGQTGAVTLTTSNVAEGSNLYHTTARARSAISATSPISYDASSGVISFNFAVANTFTAAQTALRTALGATTADGWVLDNTTSAANGAQQVSPALRWRGRGWKTQTTAASQTVDMRMFLLPVQGVAAPTGLLKLQSSVNGGAYADIQTVDTLGQTVLSVLSGATTGLEISFSASNTTPGTTRHLKLTNGGSSTFVDFEIGGQLYGAIGLDTSSLKLYARGSNGVELRGGSNLTSPSTFAYLAPSVFLYYANGAFQGKLAAGSTTSTPSSTLTSYGSTGLKTVVVRESRVLNDTETVILAYPTSSTVCGGSITYSCGHWTSESDCNLRGGHGGCAWSGGSCSDYNGNVGTCGATSGCTVVTASCSGASDQYSCEAQDDAYGGFCAWNEQFTSCSGFDESTCSMNSGCSPAYFDCSTLSGDESACGSHSGCTQNYSACVWNGSSCDGGGSCSSYGDESSCNAATYFASCSGSPYDGCSGSYSSGYVCEGNYNTGECSGTYGTCSGTSSCAGISVGDCASEPGCSAVTGISLTMPPTSSGIEPRLYMIKNDDASGTLTILPNTGQTIEGTTSIALTSKKSRILAFNRETASCSELSDGGCTPSGCTRQYSNCGYNTMDNTCGGDGGSICSAHNGNQAACEAQTYYTGCSGTYLVQANWAIMASHL